MTGSLEESSPADSARGMLDVAYNLLTARDADSVLGFLVDKLMDCFEAERGFVIFLTTDGQLDFRVSHNFTRQQVQDPKGEVSHTIVEDVALRRRPVLIKDASVHPVLKDHTSVVRKGIRSVMCTPMVAQGKLMGVLYVDNLSHGEKFSGEDLELLTLLASFTAAALDTAQLLAGDGEGGDAYAQAEKASVLGQFAAGIVHDFNSVLSAVKGRLELMQRHSAAAPLAEDIEAALEAVDIARKLADRVSKLSIVHSTRAPAEVDLSEVVCEALKLVEHRLSADGRVYRLAVNVERPVLLRGHRTALVEAVMNLLNNALDAMPEGGRLTVSLKPAADHAVLKVADTGCGVSEADKARIFEPFFTTRNRGGTGLGLAIVQTVVSGHRGRITVQSTPNKGTTFTLYLPLARNGG